MTVKDVFTNSTLPPKEAALLTAFLLSCPLEFIWAHPETNLPKNIYQKFKRLETKRQAGWSLAVLIGHKEFYGLDFKVDKNVLIPRPETEMMITEILTITDSLSGELTLLDIGTGSGIIVITATSLLKNSHPQKYRRLTALAIDISRPALKIARQNATKHHQEKKIKFLTGSLLTPLLKKNVSSVLKVENLIIAANLPYLTAKQITVAPSIHQEPRLALMAGADGLKYYRELLKQLNYLKKITPIKNHSQRYLLCEIDPSQTTTLSALAQKYLDPCQVTVRKDLAGHNRLIIINW